MAGACNKKICPQGSSGEGIKGLFVHPVSDPAVIAGNGTIGLEILEDLPDVDTVIVPYGGGGLDQRNCHGHKNN